MATLCRHTPSECAIQHPEREELLLPMWHAFLSCLWLARNAPVQGEDPAVQVLI